MNDDQISREAAIETLWEARECLEKSRVMFLEAELPSVAYNRKIERNRVEEDIALLRDVPAAEPQIKCIAKITLNEEQIRDAVEKAKREILAVLPRWIPCSERLPTESDDYICTYGSLSGKFVDISIYETEKKEFGFYSENEHGEDVWYPVTNVVAWMKLPKPYGGEQIKEAT